MRQKDKTLIIETSLISPHSETGLELYLTDIDRGNLPYYLDLYNYLPTVENYIFRENKFFKEKALNFTKKIRNHFQINFVKIPNLKIPRILIPDFSKVELESLYIESFPIGKSIRSMLHSMCKLDEIDLSDEKTQAVAELLYLIGAQAYYTSYFALDSLNPNLAYIFNGRYVTSAACRYACKKRKVKYLLHERGSSHETFKLTADQSLQNIETFHRNVISYCKLFPDEIISIVAAKFYTSNRKKIELVTGQHSKNQIPDKVPPYCNTSDYSVYFCSSQNEICEDEKSEWDIGLGCQREAVAALVKIYTKHKKLLVIRMHPNSGNQSEKDLLFYNSIKSDYVRIILPNDTYCSYRLAENSETVISFISTMGIEASYLGKPVICMGKSAYYFSDDIMKPRNVYDLENYVLNPIMPENRRSAEKIAFYLTEVGFNHFYYKPEALFSGTINNINIFE